jgi:hypothetical protein
MVGGRLPLLFKKRGRGVAESRGDEERYIDLWKKK